jgi:hypothetical protein
MNNDFTHYFNNILKFVALVVIMSLLSNPESIGRFQARMDIGYDQIWSEYVADCDCTEALE